MGIKRRCAQWLIQEFSDKNWKWREKIVKKGARNWFTWSYRKWHTTHITQLSGAAWSSRWLLVQLTNGQYTCELVFKLKADVLNIVVTINLFSLYLMNFTLHTMLDAAGVVLRVHYKVLNVMFYFHKVAYVQYLCEVGIFHTGVKKIYSSLQECKNYKNRSRFSKVMSTNVLPPFFMVHSVYVAKYPTRRSYTRIFFQSCFHVGVLVRFKCPDNYSDNAPA